jgi:hypothetical protein
MNLRLEQFPKNQLIVQASKTWTSPKFPTFVPDQQTAAIPQQPDDAAPKEGTKAAVIAMSLQHVGLEYGAQAEEKECEMTIVHCEKVKPGWATYPKAKKSALLSVSTLQVLKQLYDSGKGDKSKRISADRAHVIIMEQVAACDWHEQMICTIARIKVFFSQTPAKMSKLIRQSEEVEALLEQNGRIQNDHHQQQQQPLVQPVEQQQQQLLLQQELPNILRTEEHQVQQPHEEGGSQQEEQQQQQQELRVLPLFATLLPVEMNEADETLGAEDLAELEELEEAEMDIIRESLTMDT